MNAFREDLQPTSLTEDTIISLQSEGDIVIENTAPGTIHEAVSATTGNVTITNTGDGASLTISALNGNSIVNTSPNYAVTITNGAGASLTLNGALRNENSGNVTVTNAGTMDIIGAIYNIGTGAIDISNTGVMLHIHGNVYNSGSGDITLTDFTLIDGHVVGEKIHLTGSGVVNGMVVGNIYGTETLTTTNEVHLDGVTVGSANATEIVAGAGALTAQTFGGNTLLNLTGDTTIYGDVYGGGLTGIDIDGTTTVNLGELPVDPMAIMPFGITTNVVTIVGDVYGGGLSSLVKNDVTVNLTGTALNNVKLTGNLYGGAKNGSVYGNVAINISGAPATGWITGNVYGGSYGGNIGKTDTMETVAITVNGGRIDGNIYAAGVRTCGSNGNVYGNATITFKGSGSNLQFNGSVNGFGVNGAVVSAGNQGANYGKTTLKFDGYTGNFNATANGFTNMYFVNGASVTMASNMQINQVGSFTFDYGSGTGSVPSLILYDPTGAAPVINNISVIVSPGQLQQGEYVLIQGNSAVSQSFNNDPISLYNSGGNLLGTITVNNTGSFYTQGSTNIYSYTTFDNKLVIGIDSSSCVNLSWATDFWQRGAPARATARANSGTYYLGSNSSYYDNDSFGTVSTKAQITGSGTIYGGSSGRVITGNTWLNVIGGTSLTVYGGGNNYNVNGSSNIYIFKNGTTIPGIAAVYGGGSGTSTVGASYITIAGANFGTATTTAIYGGGNGANTTVGSSNITFTGAASDLTFLGTADGGGASGGTVTGTRNLYFGDLNGVPAGTQRNFTGTYSGNFKNFTNMTVRTGSTVTLTAAGIFQANNWNINGSLTTAGATMDTYNASTLALTVAAGGTVTDQFKSTKTLVVNNSGTVNGALVANGSVTLNNSGTATGEYCGATLALTNNASGSLNGTINNGAGTVTSLTINNAGTAANVVENNGTVNLAAAGNWLTNTGVLTLKNSGSLTVAGNAVVNNTGGTLTLLNTTGSWNYTGQILGNTAATAGHITLQNQTGTMTMTGVYNSTYDRNVLVISQNPTAGSSFAIVNGSSGQTTGIMTLNGAIYALSTEALTVTNYGTLTLGDGGVGTTGLRAMLNAAGTGGVTVDNYNSATVQGIRNEWGSIGGSGGTMDLHNYAGTFTGTGRLFDNTVVLPLAPADLAAVLAAVNGQVVAATNIGAVMNLTNDANSTFDFKGTMLNAVGGALNATNTGTMKIGALYDVSGNYLENGTYYRDSLYNYKTTGTGISVTNTGAMTFRGALVNDQTGSITVNNSTAAGIMNIYGNSSTGYAAWNKSAGAITITNTGGTLNIYGNVTNTSSGTVTINNYTLISGNVTGKNITLTGSGMVQGNITGGEIVAGETSTVTITGGTIGVAGNTVSGVTGSVSPGATDVNISGVTTVNSKIYGGGNVAVTGQSSVTLDGTATGAAVNFKDHVYGGGSSSAGTVGSVLMTLKGNVTAATGVNVYGGGNGANVLGNVTLNVTSGNYKLIYGGGNNATVGGNITLVVSGSVSSGIWGGGATISSMTNGDIALSVSNSTINGSVVGGGNSNVTGNISLTLGNSISDNSYYSGQIYGGSSVGSAASQGLTTGTITVTVNGGSFQGLLTGGHRIAITDSTKNLTHTSGKVSMNVSGGTFASSQSIYVAGYAIASSAMTSYGALNLEVQGVNFNYSGGNHSGIDTNTGRGVYLGGLASQKSKMDVTGVTSTISGGTIGFLYGGGYSDGGVSRITTSASSAYAVNILLEGTAAIGVIYAGGNRSTGSTGSASVIGDSLITIRSVESLNNVFAGGRDSCYVTGNSTVSLEGSSNYNFNVNGNLVNGNRILSFNGYTGTFSGTVTNMNVLETTANAHASYNNAAGSLANVNQWEFDVAGSTTGQTQAAFNLLAGANSFSGDAIRLLVDTASQNGSTWQLYSGVTTGINLANVTIWDKTTDTQLAFGTASGNWEWSYDASKVWLTKIA